MISLQVEQEMEQEMHKYCFVAFRVVKCQLVCLLFVSNILFDVIAFHRVFLPLNPIFGYHEAKWALKLLEKLFFPKKVDFPEDEVQKPTVF